MTRWEPGAKERLQAAALDLFATRGFDQTTAADIAGSVGLTERTFFRHFSDKREVLFSGHHGRIAAWRRDRAVELTRQRRPDLLPHQSGAGELVIVPAVAADAGELLTLQRAAYVVEGRLHDSFDFPPLTDDLAAVEQLIADTTCLVARRDGRMVGSVFGRTQDDGSWFVGRLMVAPDLQGGGLGRRLLDLIEDSVRVPH